MNQQRKEPSILNFFSRSLQGWNSKKNTNQTAVPESLTNKSDIKSISIATGQAGEDSSGGPRRRVGLSEKSESDRRIVKKILKETVKHENIEAMTF